MPQNSKFFFKEQKDWSKRKLAIISAYLEGFVKILGSSTNHSCVYFVDGFAGKGTYDDMSKGSPILAAELAQKYLDLNKKYKLNCINVESDEENFRNLEIATNQYQNIVENLKGTFSTNISSILNSIGNCPAFFFIDPFGVSGADWIDMLKIIHRQAPTDLWLRFDHKTVRRLSGFFESGSRGANSKVQRLLKLYGVQRVDNLFQRLDGNTREERIENAVNYYIERLEIEYQNGKNFGYSAAFPIISLEGQNKYYLVFAAAHSKAVFLANETVYSVERNRPQEMQEYQQKKTGQLFLFPSEINDEEIRKFLAEELAVDIWQLCKDKVLVKKELYMMLLKDSNKKRFGHFTNSHLNLALSIMESENNPRLTQRTGPISQDNSILKFR
jgi:three-Cys-motif partner protein